MTNSYCFVHYILCEDTKYKYCIHNIYTLRLHAYYRKTETVKNVQLKFHNSTLQAYLLFKYLPIILVCWKLYLYLCHYVCLKEEYSIKFQTVKNVAKIFYKRMHSNLRDHRNPLISDLSVPTIPGDPRRRLKRTYSMICNYTVMHRRIVVRQVSPYTGCPRIALNQYSVALCFLYFKPEWQYYLPVFNNNNNQHDNMTTLGVQLCYLDYPNISKTTYLLYDNCVISTTEYKNDSFVSQIPLNIHCSEKVVEITRMILTGSFGNIWVVEITRKYPIYNILYRPNFQLVHCTANAILVCQPLKMTEPPSEKIYLRATTDLGGCLAPSSPNCAYAPKSHNMEQRTF
ncbi:formin-like protein 2 [Aphis craccivora]|uniref:Formin-like protein 2 n=1 Tax=Aphis craccivora TaxID=307492 RepID=A0A6G0ZAI0_APHCR|nr:formin-like protein 2 [Aphis craccivora]